MDEEFVLYLSILLPRYFGKLPASQMKSIAGRLQRVHLGSGQLLYRQGQVLDDMHFVVTGRLEVWTRDTRADPHIASHLSSGDCVGELSLLTGQPHFADVVVTRDTVLGRLNRRDYDELVRHQPHAAR